VVQLRQKKIAIEGGEHFVYGELQEQGADDGKQFKSRGQDEDLGESALEADNAANEVAQPERAAFIAGSEAGGRRKFQRDAGEIASGFSIAETARPHGRIMQVDVFRGRFLQHHKVVHLPVQDAGSSQVGQIFHLHPQRASSEVQGAGEPDDVIQGGAAQ
jgi:hypothetical protein